MNYKNIIDIIQTICDNHYFINQFGYGEISDINTPEDKEPPNYPYVFINPVNISMGDKTTSFNFNLICMTQAYDTQTDTIQQQSNCMVYVKDIISKVNMTLDNPLIQFIEPYNITPFKERFSDDVVGATANISIEYANVLDNCFSKISGDTPTIEPGPPVRVIDGDETIHYVNPGGSYSCLPATPKTGIFYQRQLPWQNNDPGVIGSVYYHITIGTYNYTPPTNPETIAMLKNGYENNDAGALLARPNIYGNYYRFTNDRGQQYVEGFAEDPSNASDNPRYCIDHFNGLGWYVQQAYNRVFRTYAEAMAYANSFDYNGLDRWRVADVGEYLNSVNYNDYNNSYTSVYAPMVDNNIRNYGGQLWYGSFTRDNQYAYLNTNGGTIQLTSNAAVTNDHILMVRNHFIS